MKKILQIFLMTVLVACSHRVMPPSGSTKLLSEKALRGQEIFYKNCDRCHPGGMAGRGPALINKPLPAFFIKFQVRNGLGAMPSFKKDRISKDELNDIVAYIKNS